MRHRTKKQIVIALIFFGFWGGVAGLAGLIAREPSPPPTPSPRIFQPLEVVSTIVLPTFENKADIVGLVRNPNADAGAEKIKYQFTIRDADSVIKTITGETFILPGRQKYLIAFDQEIPLGKATAELTVEQPEWISVGEDFKPPSLVLINKTSRIIPGNPDIYEFKGLLKNQSDVDYLRVEIVTVGFDDQGKIVGVGYTFSGSLLALEQREFTAQWPLAAGAEVAVTQVFPTVNVFSPDAVYQREEAEDVRNIPLPVGPSPQP